MRFNSRLIEIIFFVIIVDVISIRSRSNRMKNDVIEESDSILDILFSKFLKLEHLMDRNCFIFYYHTIYHLDCAIDQNWDSLSFINFGRYWYPQSLIDAISSSNVSSSHCLLNLFISSILIILRNELS